MKEHKTTVKVTVGDQDGIAVIPDPENSRYLVECPNSYDVNWLFRGKIQGKDYATLLPTEDKRRVVFAVSLEDLSTETQIKNFNIKVNEARKTNKEILDEKQHFEDSLSFDMSQDDKPVSFLYANPSKGYCTGKVLKTGKYFVAMTPSVHEHENTLDAVLVRVIYTSRLLNGKDEFANREEAIKEKFPVGSKKYLTFDDTGKITVGDYKAKQTEEQKPQQPAADQVEELAKELSQKAAPKSRAKQKSKQTLA